MSKVVRAIVGVAAIAVGVFVPGMQFMIGVGAALVGGVLMQPKIGGAKNRAASSAQVQLGEVPRQAIVGTAATAGSLVDAFNYGGKYGTDWEVLVLALADHRCDGLTGFYVNDSYVAFTGDGNVAGYNGQLQVFWRPGTEDQTVPAILTSHGPGWTANDNGAGVAHVVVAYKADDPEAKNPIWTGGRPRFLWVVRGALCYDARKDSSVGGSGAHRINLPATWAYSDNPIVTRYKWVRGFYACDRVGDPTQLMIGRGLSAVEAPPQNVFARANLCDETVDGEKRYRVGGAISATEAFIEVEEDFAAACAGTIVQPEGCVEIDPGEARAVVATFTDDDLVVGSRVRWNNRMLSNGSDEWINTIVPTYIEPTQKWAEHAAPVRRDPADLVADGAPREHRLLLGFVTWTKQAQRVGEIVRRLGRLPGRAEVTLPPRFADIEEGDWVQWQSARRFGGATLTFRVEAWSSDKAWHHTLTLRQISASVFSDTAPLDDGSIAYQPPPPPAIGAPEAGAWTLAGGYMQGASGASPALIVTGARDDPAARFVRIEYVEGVAVPGPSTEWIDNGVFGPDMVRREIPVAGGAAFYVAVSYVVEGVTGDRRVLGPVTTPEQLGVGKLFIQSNAPGADESTGGDRWQDDSGRIWRRRGSNYLAIGGKRITIGGKRVTITWTPNATQPMLTIAQAASAAQQAADAAGSQAAAANARLTEIASDDLLTPGEKPQVILDVTTITAEQAGIVAQAAAFGITTERTAYENAVTALGGYLAGLTAPTAWNNLAGNTAIVGTAFRTAFADVYAARQALLNKIAAVAKAQADAASAAAAAAQHTADTAEGKANIANALLAEFASDNLLTPGEKPPVLIQVSELTGEQASISARASGYGVTTERTAYNNAVAALSAYMATLTTPFLWSDLGGNTDIVGSTFRAKFGDVYDARDAVLDRIAEEAGKRALWGGIGGPGKPEDDADVTSIITGPAEIIVNADYTGAVTTALPLTQLFQLMRNGANVGAAATWGVQVVSGTIAASFPSPGLLSLNKSGGVLTTSMLRITAEIGTAERTIDVKITKRDAAPPIGGGGGGDGTTATTSSFAAFGAGGWASVMGSPAYLEVTAGSAGKVNLTAPTLFYSVDHLGATGFFSCNLQWQKWNGSAWVNIGSPTGPDFLAYNFGFGDQGDGAISCNHEDSGLTPSTSHRYRLTGLAADDLNIALFGTASAVGS